MVKGYVEWARESVTEHEVKVGRALHLGVRNLDFFSYKLNEQSLEGV